MAQISEQQLTTVAGPRISGDALLAAMGDPVVVVGFDTTLLWANRAAEDRFGWLVDDKAGQTLGSLVHPDDVETAMLSLSSVQTKETGTLVAIRVRDRSGVYGWFEVRGRVCPPELAPGAVVLNLRESSRRGQWQLAGGDPVLLSAVIDAAPAVIMLLDRDGRVRGTNRAFTRILGRSLESSLGQLLGDMVDPDDRTPVCSRIAATAEAAEHQVFEARFCHVRGHTVPLGLTMVNMLDDRAVEAIVVTAVDVTQLAEARAELEHLASHDSLTGLANRSRLRVRLGQILTTSDASSHSLLFGDVDGLKAVNDGFGHQAGDVVLATIADRLRSLTRREDLVARVSGDEFVVIVASSDERAVAELQARITNAMHTPIRLPSGHLVTVSVSVGVTGIVQGADADELLAAADAAMYVVKRRVASTGL